MARKTRKEELAEIHNKGQTDAKDGKYDPPRLAVEEIFSKSAKEERAAYKDGQENHEKQRR
jgi:hypothetical protein